MRSRLRAVAMSVGLALGGAFLMAVSGSSCSTFAGEALFSQADFCFIFDCQNGILGGTIDPCARAGSDVGGRDLPLFIDCPDFTAGP